MKRVPKFIAGQHGGSHAFRSEKRKMIRQLIKLMDKARFGSAYMPGYEKFKAVDDLLNSLKKDISVKNWGR